MILDKPKRRAETIVVVALVDENEAFEMLNRRLCRAFDEVKKGFDIDVCWGDRITEILDGDKKRLRFSLTITAVIHSESLESRWARALDMIRDQYGLQIEWEREEVRERTGFKPGTWASRPIRWDEIGNPNIIEDLQSALDQAEKETPWRLDPPIIVGPKTFEKLVEERKSQLLKLKKDGVCFNVEIYYDDNSDDVKYRVFKQVQYHFGAKVAYMENSQLYVRANSFGLCGGEQPRNIVNMGCYQLPNGSIWRIDVHAEPQIAPPVEESFGPVNIEIGEGEVARIPGTFIIHDEVSDDFDQEGYDRLKQAGLRGADAGAKLAGKVELTGTAAESGKMAVCIGNDRVEIPISKGMTAGEIAGAINEKAGVNVAGTPPKPPRKSYSDTPTGTVAWNNMTGNMRRGLLENGVPSKYRFCDALHLVPWDDGDFVGMDIACPVCGECDSSHDCLFRAQHVSELFDCRHKSDENTINEMKDCKCDSCHHHLTYDFENETVTIRTTSSHCEELGE